MRVVVDLDGVCYEWSKTARYMFRTYRGHKADGPLGEESSYWEYIPDHVSKEDWNWLWTEGVKLGLFRYGHMIRDARVGLQALHDRGWEIVIATNRPEAGVMDTVDWVSFYFRDIPIRGLHILNNDTPKSTVAGTLMIDDKPENVEEWVASKEGRRALLFDQPWNQHYSPSSGVDRVEGWQDLVEISRKYDQGTVGLPQVVRPVEQGELRSAGERAERASAAERNDRTDGEAERARAANRGWDFDQWGRLKGHEV